MDNNFNWLTSRADYRNDTLSGKHHQATQLDDLTDLCFEIDQRVNDTYSAILRVKIELAKLKSRIWKEHDLW